jgi:hypothetical protein
MVAKAEKSDDLERAPLRMTAGGSASQDAAICLCGQCYSLEM